MSTIDILRDLEQRRKKIQMMTIVPLILFFGLFFGYFAYATSPLAPLVFFGVMIGMVVCATKASKEKKEFQRIYKDTFVVGAIREILGNVTYEPFRGFSEYEVANTGVIQMGNRFSSEDYIAGYYDGVHFRQSDVVVKRVVRSGKSTHTYVHFSGRLFEFDCPLDGNVSTLLFSKNYQYPGHGLGLRYEKIKMENEAFNKRFKIKAARDIDAFYILTPHMMECIDNILMKAKSVGLHFANNKLYLGINYGGSSAFDANMNRPLVYVNELEKVKADTKVIVDIVRTLKLDQNAREDQLRKHGAVMDPLAGIGQRNGQMNDYPNSQMSGQMNGYPNDQMNGYPNGQMNGYPNGQMNGQMGEPIQTGNSFYNEPPVESKYGFTLKK